MPVHWIDVVIVLIIAYHVYEGWERGLALLLANLGSFLISLWLAVRYHGVVGSFIVEKFGIAPSWTSVLGYAIVALVSQIVLEEAFVTVVHKLPEKLRSSRINHWLGSIISLVNALVVISFFLLLTLSLPLRGSIKNDIREAPIASMLVTISDRYGGSVRSSLEEAAREALKFLTVEPGSRDTIPLELPEKNLRLSVDPTTESEMVILVNSERSKQGLETLVYDPEITEVARGKSRDMFERRYFSHYDPDGNNAADRMNDANVRYQLVGENLAYAPDLRSAHEGLMNSEGHRANILETRFRRIGIGVIDGGPHGKMFTQIFAD